MGEKRRLPWYVRVLAVFAGFWLVAPTLIVVPMSFTGRESFAFPPQEWSFDYYVAFFTDPVWLDSLYTSLRLAAVVTVLATVCGAAAAFGIVRGRLAGGGAVNGVLLTPIILPQIVAATAIYIVYLNTGLAGTFVGLVIAHTGFAIPFVTVAVSANLRTVDPRLDRAAASLGASPLTTFRTVTLPLILPGVLSGAVFAFAVSLDEVVIALFLSTPAIRTLPVQMFTSVTTETDPTIAAASTVVVAATTVLLIAAVASPRARRAAIQDFDRSEEDR